MIEDDRALDQAIERTRAAVAEFVDGRPGAWKAHCSHAADATLFGGWGGYERGWTELGPRYDWAAARWAGGSVTFEEIARHVSAELACTIHFERSRARLAGSAASVAVALRVTHLYRRERDGWRLLHRHADPLVAIQATESVIARERTWGGEAPPPDAIGAAHAADHHRAGSPGEAALAPGDGRRSS